MTGRVLWAWGIGMGLALIACSSGGASAPTGDAGSSCTDVVDCNTNFKALTALGGCGACIEESCGSEVAACGPRGEQCAASVACYADPVVADWSNPNGTCVQAGLATFAWPRACYVMRQECVDVRAIEPAGLELFRCMATRCTSSCFGSSFMSCPTPAPPCSTVKR